MKKMYVLSLFCFSVFICTLNPVFSQNTEESSSTQIDIPYECEEDLIEIMFEKDSEVRLRNGSLVDLKTDALLGVDQILVQLDWHTWYRICDVSEDLLDQWSINGERNTGKPVYNLNNIYRLQIPKGLNIWETSAMLEELPGVLLARPVPKPMELPIPPNYQSSQGYLNPASSTPTGIDAAYAWTQTGGTGTGVTICDLEYSWNYNHNDISKAAGSQINTNTADPPPYAGPNHGTAVIGQLVADNNSWGTTGICYGANLKTCGTYYGTPSPSWNVPGAMAVAIASLSAGDIILLEQQWDYDNNSSTLDFLPIEWWLNYSPNAQTFNGVYAAITNAISNGIHVVEAGGNGAQNTDLLTWYGNSGAIIVGAGGAYSGGTYPYGDLQKLWFSSYGSRFDLQGWGENVVTTGYGDLYGLEGTNYWYTNTFSGTSSASPIVAGALACAEGYWLANVSATPPTPAYMRTHLKTYGTAQITPPAGNIGPRPNLYAAINNFPPPQQYYDWGDAPDGPYPTVLASNGARHQITALFLGNNIDAEQNGQPSINADLDDLTGVPDDEDGVTLLGPLVPGTNVNIQVTASAIGGLLQAWVDFNGNGTWVNAGEQIFTNQSLNPGINPLSFFVPATAITGPTYARFRLSTIQNVPFFGLAPDGEVEDYYYWIDEPQDMYDWGDAPDPLYPTLMASNGANHFIDGITYLGAMVDSEPDGQPEPMAMGDDNDIIYPPPNDDEDGVSFLTPFIQNQMASIDVFASVPGTLNAWLDFAQDGSWAEAGDHIFIDAPLVAGNNPLNIWVPSTTVPGSTFIRFRFSSQPGLSWVGQAIDGEVEDYMIDIDTQGAQIKWEQLPDLSPTGMDVDATWQPDDPDNPPLLLADDFLCTETGYITDIHIWGSWLNDELPYWEVPEAVQFTFSIHADIPDPDGAGPEYSMPGDMLWMKTWNPTYNDVEWINSGVEDWYNPFYPTWIDDNHTMCFKYNYILDPVDYFLQEGTPGQPIVYWLDVQAVPQDPSMPNVRFGWKTSLDHWNDDAVWIDAIEQYNGPWNELRYPLGHEFETESIDLAFQITTEGGPAEEFDFGDAPEDALAYPSLGIVGNFPTCVGVPVAGWIEHQTMDLFFTGFDLENEGNAGLCPSFNPNQYNQDECFADGDAGLIIPDGFTIVGPIGSETVQPCTGANNQHLGYTCTNAIWGVDIDIDVNNAMATGNQGYLNVYVDWNQDGQWSGSSNCPGYAVPEHALVDFPIPYGHSGPVSGLMAANTPLAIGPDPGYVWARFTLTDVPVGSDWDASGSFEDGETEDYLLLILEQEDQLDFGDADDPPYPTWLGSNGARHIIDGVTYLGASVDAETDGQPDPQALGDDNDGNDDEDGVTFDWPLAIGGPCKITVNASVDSVLFSGWVDFDGNGSWADANEQVFADVPLDAGDNSLYFMVPLGTTPGLTTYARFRCSNQPGLSYDGPASDGEVEDYEVDIVEIDDYKWAQYPDTTLPGLHAHDYLNTGGGIEAIVLADDWLCNGGLVTDIHWWGNYELDAASQEIRGLGINYFHLSIHVQSAAGCLPMDPEVWSVNIPFTSLTETYTGMNNNENSRIYLYEYVLNIPFDQEAGLKYWVDITASSNNLGQPAHWRWQESMRSYYPIYCGAADKIDPGISPWSTIQWLPNAPHKYSDMAFIITSQDLEPMDFGDAADPTYPTYFVNDGARHLIDGTTYMGLSVDAEFNGQSDPSALGDDNDGNDDEDGVTFIYPLIQGNTEDVDVVVSVDGYISAWVDFNDNGSWADPGEQIASDYAVTSGSNTITFNIPLTAVINDSTFARFRFTTYLAGLSYTGLASDGEVEDHALIIQEIPNKWAQYPDTTLPGLHAHDYDLPPYGQIILADDWICDGGWVTDFHWWGNYELDPLSQEIRGAGIDHFHLSIHTNDPSACLPQDPEIWGADVSPAELNTGLINIEGCPIYLYEYVLGEPFPQIQGEHYWLDITAVCSDPTDPALWRWQEALRDTSLIVCAAAEKILPSPGNWDDIVWPQDKYSQMAFVITSGPAPELDMGDADDPTYPTLLVNNGAAHILDGVTFLGASVDSDPDGQPDPNALGDDNDGNDDEDGVTINPIFPVTPGNTFWYDVVASVDGILNIWIDWNANGSWGDAGEHVQVDYGLTAGLNTIFIFVPANANVGDTYARFRFDSTGGLSYTGIAQNGEVEDHELKITGDLDFGDAPDQALPKYPTLLASNGARHLIDPTIFLGYSIDLEPDGQPDMPATGDDLDGNDDEDGVLIPPVLSHGSMNTITVIASVDGYLNGWIDFNSSGDWVEADEHVLMDQIITAGPNTLNIAIPASSVKGTTYARFRFCTATGFGLSYDGQAPDGEVEDYQVEIGEPEKWIQYPDTTDLGIDVDATFDMFGFYPPMILADDFLCDITGPITRIEVWGSWYHDHYPFFVDPGAVMFTLSIHEDIPADQNPLGYSMPGDVIWFKTYDLGMFMFEPYAFGLSEGWYNPAGPPFYEPFADTECWKYIFNLDEGEFIQEGTPDEPKVYWLDVQATPLNDDDIECRFGWKTSQDHWNDDAVWTIGNEPYLGPWNELIYPPTHPLEGQSIDLAFAIYGLEHPYVLVDLTAFLEGPFNGSDMQPALNGAGLIPLNQPYTSDLSAIWYYTGTESVASIPGTDIVDWVMIEIRDATTASNATGFTMIDEKAAFIKRDGRIVATDGASMMKFYVSFANNPYAVVWHRNHLGILSANPLNMIGLGLYNYDFSSGPGQAYLNGQKDLGGGIFGMLGGDGQPDGTIDINDVINVWAPAAGTTGGYLMSDFNMDIQIDNKDKNDVWYPNNTSNTKVP